MNIIPTFPLGKYKFKCTKCGKCCFPHSLSLTPKEKESIEPSLKNKHKIIFDFNPPFQYTLLTRGRCPFLKDDKLCAIYNERPIVCRAFPLTFEYSPSGELFVNFIRCEGDDVEDGEPVDM